jgi:hypothetical protein
VECAEESSDLRAADKDLLPDGHQETEAARIRSQAAGELMAKNLESGGITGVHLHSVLSLAPPAMCDVGAAGGRVEEFDFLEPQRRLRRLAAIGVVVIALGALGLVGRLASRHASGPAAVQPTAQLAAAASRNRTEPPSPPAPTGSKPLPELERAPGPTASLAVVSETTPRRMAGKPAARLSAKAKLGGRRRSAWKR